MTRKDFLLRSGAAALPLSMVGAGAAFAAESSQAPPPPLVQAHFDIRQFGAKGDGQVKDTQAIQSAIDAAGKAGGLVYLPPGKYLSGTVRLKSHVSVYLEAGATLLSSPDKDDFDPYEKLDYKSFSDDETTDFHYALLRGQDIEHVGVFGPGIIDGNRTKRRGPKPIALKNCRHIAIRDITLQNSPNYNISLLGCDHVNIEGVTILNGYCDGIDPDCCHHVRIANCYVESWDDAIVPKASFALGYRRSTENVTVTNCVLTTACNALKLGTESSGDFKNISFSNCTIYGRPDLWKRNPTSGVALEMVDGATIDRVVVSNIAMANVIAPIFIRQGSRGRAQKVPKPETLQNISISDIVATGAYYTSSITGIPGFPVRNVTLKNLRLSTGRGANASLADRNVPEMVDGYPDAGRFEDLPAYGLYCRHVEGLNIDNLSLHLEQADGRPALIADDVGELDLRAITADPPSGDQAALWLRDVRGCFMQGSRARAGTKIFARISGEKSAGIRLLGNDFSEAEKPWLREGGVAAKAIRQEANLMPG